MIYAFRIGDGRGYVLCDAQTTLSSVLLYLHLLTASLAIFMR